MECPISENLDFSDFSEVFWDNFFYIPVFLLFPSVLTLTNAAMYKIFTMKKNVFARGIKIPFMRLLSYSAYIISAFKQHEFYFFGYITNIKNN